MEKRNGGNTCHEMTRVVLTGPECTGKSTLAMQLAGHYNAPYIPEYAREYISGLRRSYTYSDVLHIARTQVRQKEEYSNRAGKLLFLDTYLIITKVWFDVVFHRYPKWIDRELARNDISLYLLCDVDIPWKPDPVRENGGEMRHILLEIYRKEMEERGFTYRVVSGRGAQRLQHAISHVDEYMSGHSSGNSITKY